jgi:hypothetical protein
VWRERCTQWLLATGMAFLRRPMAKVYVSGIGSGIGIYELIMVINQT